MIDSVYRRDKNYYSQVFLAESKYIVKVKKSNYIEENKISYYITDDINIFSDDSAREDSYYSGKENSNE